MWKSQRLTSVCTCGEDRDNSWTGDANNDATSGLWRMRARMTLTWAKIAGEVMKGWNLYYAGWIWSALLIPPKHTICSGSSCEWRPTPLRISLARQNQYNACTSFNPKKTANCNKIHTIYWKSRAKNLNRSHELSWKVQFRHIGDDWPITWHGAEIRQTKIIHAKCPKSARH